MSKKDRIKRMIFIFGVCGLVFGGWKYLGLGICHIGSESIHGHVGLVSDKLMAPFEAGDFVLFEWRGPDPQGRGLKEGMILNKQVFCRPGDSLEVTRFQAICNGKRSRIVQGTDSSGEPVTPFRYEGTIPPGKFFVIGEHPKSYDSRYWGFIDRGQIIAKMFLHI